MGHSEVPPYEVLMEHGLTNFELDVPPTLSTLISGAAIPSTSSHTTHNRVAGWANIVPVPAHPLLRSVQKGQRVRVYWSPPDNPYHLSRFRRQAQISVIDNCDVDPARKEDANGAVHGPSRPRSTRKRRFGADGSPLGWWEDESGWWFITEPPEAEIEALTVVWDRMYHPTTVEGTSSATLSPDRSEEEGDFRLYGEACDLLRAVAECIRNLHSRRLSIVACRPHSFAVAVHGNERKAAIIQLTDVLPLPGFQSGAALPTEPMAETALFEKDPIEAVAAPLRDSYVRRNLRYLSPETTSSRRSSVLNDVYSFGVLAYELIAETTIDGGPQSPDENDIDVLRDVQKHLTNEIAPLLDYLRQEADFGALSPRLPPVQLNAIIMKCLSKDAEDRYSSMDSLLYDLRVMAQICRSKGDLSKFKVGAVNEISTFSLPTRIVYRESEFASLRDAWTGLCTASKASDHSSTSTVPTSTRVLNIWGLSGSGKSRIVQQWAQAIETDGGAQAALVGYAKMDEIIQKPFSSFIQIFQSLVDRVLTDPREDAVEWNRLIRQTLGHRFALFHSLLSHETRKLVVIGGEAPQVQTIDWANIGPAFQLLSKRLLQLFATKERPLLLVVDDIQWMSTDETAMWRAMLDGSYPLAHVLVASIYRVESVAQPSAERLLSSSGDSLYISKLPEAGVRALITASFPTTIDKESTLVSLICAETEGSPLYIRTLLVTLVSLRETAPLGVQVKETVIYFDFETLVWRFDPLALQAHVSDKSVDCYIERVQSNLPAEVIRLLSIVSLLPSTGLSVDLLAQFFQKSRSELDTWIHIASGPGSLYVTDEGLVRFAHDRQRIAAHRKIAKEDLPDLHFKLSKFLRRPDLADDFVYDSAKHALTARSLGCKTETDEVVVDLVVQAATKCALSSSIELARRLLDAADTIITESGGPKRWMSANRLLFIRHLQTFCDVCSAGKTFDDAFRKLDEAEPYCTLPADQVRVAILYARQLVASDRIKEAMSVFWRCLEAHGWNSPNTTLVQSWTPQTPQEVHQLGENLFANVGPVDEDDLRVQISLLICFAGPTLYSTEVHRREAVFRLGLSLCAALGRPDESTAYIVSVVALVETDTSIKEALFVLTKRLFELRPGSFLTSSAQVVSAAMAHYFQPLSDVTGEYTQAFESTVRNGNYEVAAYVFSLDMAVRRFSNKAYQFDLITDRAKVVLEYVAPVQRILINIPLQYSMRILRMPSGQDPWILEGDLLSAQDVEAAKDIPFYNSMRYIYALRLALLYDAPLDVQTRISAEGRSDSSATSGTVLAVEWSFLTAFVDIRRGGLRAEVAAQYADLERCAISPDFQYRILILDMMILLKDKGMEAVGQADELADMLEGDQQYNLAGLLYLQVARMVRETTGSERLASGYTRAAAFAYKSGASWGLCQYLHKLHPTVCAPCDVQVRFAADLAMPRSPPKMRRRSMSQSNETVASSESTRVRAGDSPVAEDSLDSLAVIRASLALAQEQDPAILLKTLLRLLCQFARADFAAIALTDFRDPNTLRLRAAGSYNKIVSCDSKIGTPEAQALAPTVVMLHVARTETGVLSLENWSKIRPDPFYASRKPKTIICLPIKAQGKQAGVILLSSLTASSHAAQSSSSRDVIECLSTFATLIATNYSFTRQLKQEVDERTKELSEALQAKTRFLSQCSHELRSPLSAVLGLSAVLEASPGLSVVQKEHLRTIISSGEDLLGLINNILDHSRLESHSVTLEHIPFVLRDLVESALDSVAAVAQKKDIEICLISSYKSDPPALKGDPFRIKQILMNLLSNAVKFTPKGQVTVRWRHESAGEGKEKIFLEVSDTGIGIAQAKMNKLFQSFSQVDESITRSYGGSGLGLIISRDLARLLGGDCTAESEYGKGSTFTFSFIADTNPDPAATPSYPPLSKPKGCFIICPLGPWWDMLSENLSALGCEPLRFAEDVKECLEKDHPHGLNNTKAFSFIILDTRMINKEVLKQMQQLQPDAKYIFLVRSIDLADAMRELDISRESILARPIKFQSLYNVILTEEPTLAVDALRTGSQPPFLESGSGKKEKKPSRKDMAKKYPLKIMIVDDNAVNVTVGQRILEMYGYSNTTSATDGQQAIEAADKTKFDLILMDLQMPVLDGFTAAKRIAASPLAGDAVQVALTANADRETEQLCLDSGFYSYLSKPLDIPKLGKLLEDVYKHRHRQNPDTKHE